MDLSTQFSLPLNIGCSVESNRQLLFDSFISDQTFTEYLEGYIGAGVLGDDDDIEKVSLLVRGDLCVNCSLSLSPSTHHSFLGISLATKGSSDPKAFITSAERMGLTVVEQYNGFAFPDDFLTVNPGEYICWWDPNYWGKLGFVESAVALPRSPA